MTIEVPETLGAARGEVHPQRVGLRHRKQPGGICRHQSPKLLVSHVPEDSPGVHGFHQISVTLLLVLGIRQV